LSKQIESLEMEIHSLKMQIEDRDNIILDLRRQLKNNQQNEEKEQDMLKMQARLESEMTNLRNN
jgi:predicted RNase H-like nuclease (RuvC/YqgF family)